MDKVETGGENEVELPKTYKLEVTKNTKGYNWTVTVRNDDIKQLMEDMEQIEAWAKNKYEVKPKVPVK